QVLGDHTYLRPGTFKSRLVVLGADGFSRAVAVGTITVTPAAPAGLISATGIPVAAVEGGLFAGQVAAFTSNDPAQPCKCLTAEIDWGDGGVSPGNIVYQGNSGIVTGSHTYLDQGDYLVSVAIAAPGGQGGDAYTSALVADPPLSADAVTITTGVGVPL